MKNLKNVDPGALKIALITLDQVIQSPDLILQKFTFPALQSVDAYL